MVINMQGNRNFRPAAKHGLPFVAFTRSESFAMTAFKHIPPLNDFLKVLESDALKSRNQFDVRLEKMHRATLQENSAMQTEEDEKIAQDAWQPKARSISQCVASANDDRPRVCEACARRSSPEAKRC